MKVFIEGKENLVNIKNVKRFQMKCAKCNEKIEKPLYFNSKVYCQTCGKKVKYFSNHCTIEDMRRLARERVRKRKLKRAQEKCKQQP